METAEMILLKGKPKTQEIASYRQDAKGVWWVEFNGGNLFPYKNRDLKVLSSPVEIAPNSCRITNKAGACFNPKRIWVYTHSLEKYYRVEFEDNVIHEYSANYLNVEESILADKDVLNLFNYLKEVSAVNIIETENGPISLHDQYDKIDFVNENCAMAPFLKPSLLKKYDGYDSYLFPFHSNRSQIEAVKRVFSSQISVIQGPPGTGKTQTILNVIANIVVRGMTVLVVSNNNSAVENVFEKLRKEGLGFIVAPLGKSENKAKFIANGQSEYPDMSDWEIECPKEISRHVGEITKELDEIFRKQEQQAKDRLELSSLETEKKYFLNDYDSFNLTNRCKMTSDSLMHMWLQIEDAYEKEYIFTKVSFIKKIIRRFRRFFLVRRVKRMLNVKGKSTLQELLIEIKTLYYITHKSELKLEIEEIDTYLKDKKAEDFSKRQVELSMAVFRHFLKHKYKGGVRKRQVFGTEDLYKRSEDVAKEYPVVLSTTFSSRGNLPNHIFDYLIMDEASQVPIDSAALALSVAKNAVIVGDTQQLPNIVENDVKPQLAEINKKYNIYEYYNCLEQSFLSSVVGILPKVPQTLLREHYRCSPMIINYCNQKFYSGNLIIMTKPRSDEQIMKVIKTVRGPLAKSLYNTKEDKWDMFNQREVDEFQCLLDNAEVDGTFDIGVITPYRGQVKLFHKNIRHKDIEIDTIHKFQGREKDTIVMSTVVNHYNSFCDDPNLINVAVSRAKNHFVLITNGNENPKDTNIGDLIDYIRYNNGDIVESNLHSIFDLLYSSYTEQRMKYLEGKPKISEYDSENIAYNVLLSILKEKKEWANLHVLPHYPLYDLIKDTSILDEQQKHFVAKTWAHVDFLISNRVSNRPILAIEVDGFAYHHHSTKQHERDKIKDSILEKYGLSPLRLKTIESGEPKKIKEEIAKRLAIS